MGHYPDKVTMDIELKPFMKKLESLFGAMNEKYDEAASHYGFQCNGCDDNCCMTLFHHHTYLEFFYLKIGFEELPSDIKKHIYHRAEEIIQNHSEPDRKTDPARTMCPANIEGKCAVYLHRPMICRLHGIPSEWSSPSKTGATRTFISSGCEEFSRKFKRGNYHKFDRTPFYNQMAMLEKQLKECCGFHQKIKKTVAEIIVSETPF